MLVPLHLPVQPHEPHTMTRTLRLLKTLPRPTANQPSTHLTAAEQLDPVLNEALKGAHGDLLRAVLCAATGDAALALALDVAMLAQVLCRRAADHLEAEIEARDVCNELLFAQCRRPEARP